jgi:hypothetical protein
VNAVAPSNTLVIPFKSRFGMPANGGNVAATIQVTSDQPLAVGGHIFFSGLSFSRAATCIARNLT